MSLYEYQAVVTNVVDGDTVDLEVDLGFGVRIKLRVRLNGIDTPETHKPTKAAGDAATEHLKQMVATCGPNFIVRTFKDKGDKYGRYLAILIGSADGEPVNLNERMLKDGHAVVAPW